MTTKRRKIAALLVAAALTTLGACDSEGSVSEDPQGPNNEAPGTQGPAASPTE